ncbi:MAG: class I SAM-dependent methyltransferase [Chitinispirillales bacterium]|jgi:2-polyprenyl-3-methyl-5-hydroxy-6-metoxy-1,4-benzoquinol methylase|nr:class I SAM-dependent methyltransferase [Chitinispirillales bacterium]
MKKYPFYNNQKIKIVHSVSEGLSFDNSYCFDTILLSEVIEHITLFEELKILDSIRANCSPNCRFVVSTPLGYMPEGTHIRGFSRSDFIYNLNTFYGKPKNIYYTDIQQIAFGYLR